MGCEMSPASVTVPPTHSATGAMLSNMGRGLTVTNTESSAVQGTPLALGKEAVTR